MSRPSAAPHTAPEPTPVRPRENPFSARRVDRLAWRSAGPEPRDRDLDHPLDRLLDRFDALGGRCAVVGPEGHGKSTLLDALEDRLAGRGLSPRRLAVHPDRPLPAGALGRFLHDVGPRDVLLVDGAGHLPAWPWWRVRRAARPAAGLVIAVHRPGRLPTLHRCDTNPALLRGLIDELLAGGPPPVPLPTAAELHARHRGDLRRALAELYDRCAGRRRVAEGDSGDGRMLP